jgi:hypothetical protein
MATVVHKTESIYRYSIVAETAPARAAAPAPGLAS